MSADVPAQVLEGEYDFGVAASDLGRAQGEGLELVAISNIFKLSPGAFFARKDSGIVTPADLAGRRIVVKSQSWQELLEAFLAQAGLTIDDVETVPGGYDMTPFFEGEVEVWAGFLTEEVVRARLQGMDLVTFPNHDYVKHGKSVFIFASQTLVQDNPDLAIRFLRASLRGWQFAIDNPSQAVDEMLAFLPELDEDRAYYIASFESAIPLIIPSGAQLGEVDCPNWLSRLELPALESISAFCTTDIFAAATE